MTLGVFHPEVISLEPREALV